MNTEQQDFEQLSSLIQRAVAAKMTPEFIQKEIDGRVERLVIESVDQALRSYSDTGKMIREAVETALKVDQLDLPSYGSVVTSALKAQIEARVADLVAGQLSSDMEELLGLAPKTVKLSVIADDMRKQNTDDYGEVITVIVERTQYGLAWVYLDEDTVLTERDKFRAQVRLLVGQDGKISSASFREHDIKHGRQIGRAFGLEQKIRAFVACGTVIELDEDAVCTANGDF